MRQKEYSLLNLGGLSIGLTCCIIILVYVNYELSYDKFHTKGDRIFRVYQSLSEGQDWAWTGGATRHIVEEEFSQVEAAVSLDRYSTYVAYEKSNGERLVFREDEVIFADPDFFKVFDFPIVKGQVGNSLTEPNKILISESIAKKYFGDEEPIGKELELTGDFNFVVTGVFKDVPENSHIQFDFLTGMVSFKAIHQYPLTAEFTSHWWPGVWTYVLLDDPASASQINSSFGEVMKKHRDPIDVKRFEPQLQPIKEIHLQSEMNGEWGPNGSLKTVYIFLAIAVFTLILACINFMNLATARAVKRAKEIGVRKVIGAARKQLIYQFFSESMLMNLVALAIAILLADILLPVFSSYVDRELPANLFADKKIWLLLGGAVVLSAFMSGFYPALYLSGFKPVNVLKGNHFKQGGGDLRKVLVVFQFALSVVLIFCTSVAYLQVRYFQTADLGFDKEQMVLINAGDSARQRYEVLYDKLQSLPVVKNVSGVKYKPGIHRGWGPNVEYEGYNQADNPWIYNQQVDHNFFDMMDIPIVEGRGFSEAYNDEGSGTLMREMFPAYTNRNFLVNEAAVKFFGKTNESIIGMPLRLFTDENGLLFSDTRGVVVGVVRDFHTSNLKNQILPTCFSPVRSDFGADINFVLVKLNTGDFVQAIAEIKKEWERIVPEVPFEYSFLNEDLANQYKTETRLGNIVGLFAIIALFISCLGLFGLSAYTVETRTKEIGIRKVLGASQSIIIRLLSRDFLFLVLIGVFIALPVGWWAMNNWLSQFAFRIEISLWIYLMAGSLAIFIAIVTVSFQSIKAAYTNPVVALKNE